MKQALHHGPQFITKRGTPAAVMLSIEDYKALLKTPSFKDFLCAMPKVDTDFQRIEGGVRDTQW